MARRRFVRLSLADELLRAFGGAVVGGLAGLAGGGLGGWLAGLVVEELAPGLDWWKAAVLYRAGGAAGGLAGWLVGRFVAEETASRDLHRIEAGSLTADLVGLSAFGNKLGVGLGLGGGAALASYFRVAGRVLLWGAGGTAMGVVSGVVAGGVAGGFAGALAWLFAGGILGDPPLEVLAADAPAADR